MEVEPHLPLEGLEEVGGEELTTQAAREQLGRVTLEERETQMAQRTEAQEVAVALAALDLQVPLVAAARAASAFQFQFQDQQFTTEAVAAAAPTREQLEVEDLEAAARVSREMAAAHLEHLILAAAVAARETQQETSAARAGPASLSYGTDSNKFLFTK